MATKKTTTERADKADGRSPAVVMLERFHGGLDELGTEIALTQSLISASLQNDGSLSADLTALAGRQLDRISDDIERLLKQSFALRNGGRHG